MWIIFLVWFLVILAVAVIVLAAARVAVVLGALPKKRDEIIGAPLPQKEKFRRKANLPRIAGNEVRITPEHKMTQDSMSTNIQNQSEVHVRSNVVEVRAMSKRHAKPVNYGDKSVSHETPQNSPQKNEGSR